MNQTATSSFLAALRTQANRGADWEPNYVSRKIAADTATSLSLPFPRWFTNGGRFAIANSRGRFRVPTLAECVTLNVGYGAAINHPTHASRTKTTQKTQKTQKTQVKQAKQAKPRVVAPATHASTNLASLIRSDQANTAMQSSVSTALGVDVLLGSSESVPYVPRVAKTYVPWGYFTELQTLIGSAHFLPVMVVGPSGNGKTELCEQVCASLTREYVRVNITSQTDEDDLLGGFRLIKGETKFSLGPIPLAMLRGAVVNLDEIDLGGAALMCLQPVLEGKPLYLKKIGRYIDPAPGFTVIATANTKGRGDDGKYAHTSIMNEALLDRFAITFEQGWPDPTTERKILTGMLKKFGKYNATLVKHLVEWAGVTRTNFTQQICNDQIATRRLLHITRAFCALGSIESAITHTTSRFDVDTQTAFKNLWNAFHENPSTNPSPSGETIAVDPFATDTGAP